MNHSVINERVNGFSEGSEWVLLFYIFFIWSQKWIFSIQYATNRASKQLHT